MLAENSHCLIGQVRLSTGNLLAATTAANMGYRYYAHHLHTHYNCDWPIGTGELVR